MNLLINTNDLFAEEFSLHLQFERPEQCLCWDALLYKCKKFTLLSEANKMTQSNFGKQIRLTELLLYGLETSELLLYGLETFLSFNFRSRNQKVAVFKT